MANNVKWYQSKTKAGSLVAGIGLCLGTVAGLIEGVMDWPTALGLFAAYIGSVVTVFGIRDAL